MTSLLKLFAIVAIFGMFYVLDFVGAGIAQFRMPKPVALNVLPDVGFDLLPYSSKWCETNFVTYQLLGELTQRLQRQG
jgi:hypothetical protein